LAGFDPTLEEWNRAKVKKLTGFEIWLMVVGPRIDTRPNNSTVTGSRQVLGHTSRTMLDRT
jgi:hypothetical protein